MPREKRKIIFTTLITNTNISRSVLYKIYSHRLMNSLSHGYGNFVNACNTNFKQKPASPGNFYSSQYVSTCSRVFCSLCSYTLTPSKCAWRYFRIAFFVRFILMKSTFTRISPTNNCTIPRS